MKKPLVVITITILVLALLAGAGYVIRKKLKAQNNSTTVRLETVKKGTLTEFVSAPGEIEPKTKVEISAKVSARIVELPYDEHDHVIRGNPNANPPISPSVLVRLDSKDLESQLRSAQAGREAQSAQIEVDKARIASQKSTMIGLEASLNQAKRDLERQKGLFESKDISQSTYDQSHLSVEELQSQYNSAKHSLLAAELNLVVLQHNLDAAEARIAQAEEALSYTTITSPIDGVVTRLNAEVGEVVIFGTMNNPGTVIMEVADLSKLLVVAEVGEADVGKLEVGQKATIEVDAYTNHQFIGIVDNIALAHTVSRTNTKYYRTEILLKNVDRKLNEGLTAHVDIETKTHENVITVPTQAVMGRSVEEIPLEIRDESPLVDKTKNFATVVYRYVEGKAVITPVKIGPSDLANTIITDGIKEGDKIIIGPYKELEKIKHDQKIQDERDVKAKKDSSKSKTNANKTNDVNDVNDANDPNNK